MSRISFSLINCDREFSRRRSHFCLINPCKQKDKLYFLHKRCLLALHHLSVRESHRILSLDDTLFFSSSFIEKKPLAMWEKYVWMFCRSPRRHCSAQIYPTAVALLKYEALNAQASGHRGSDERKKRKIRCRLGKYQRLFLSNRDLLAIFIKGVDFFSMNFNMSLPS